MRFLLAAFLLAATAAAEDESRLGSLIRWYLREESPARRQDLLEAIERLAQGDPRPVADAIRKGEHYDHPERPALKKGGKQPVFDLRRPRVQPVDECAGDLAELVLPEGYTPSRAYPLLLELAPTGLATPKDTVLLRVHLAAHAQAKASAEAADLLVMSLLAHVTEIVHVDPRRVFLFAGERDEAALAWCIALHEPDRFAGLLAGPGAWKEGIDLAPNAAFFSSVGVVNRKGDRTADAFLAEIAKYGPSHLRLESLGDREQNRTELAPQIEAWWQACSRPAAPPGSGSWTIAARRCAPTGCGSRRGCRRSSRRTWGARGRSGCSRSPRRSTSSSRRRTSWSCMPSTWPRSTSSWIPRCSSWAPSCA